MNINIDTQSSAIGNQTIRWQTNSQSVKSRIGQLAH